MDTTSFTRVFPCGRGMCSAFWTNRWSKSGQCRLSRAHPSAAQCLVDRDQLRVQLCVAVAVRALCLEERAVGVQLNEKVHEAMLVADVGDVIGIATQGQCVAELPVAVLLGCVGAQ